MRNERIDLIAGMQDGLITRRQAEAVGASPMAIRHALRPDGPWQKVVRGIYATFTGPLLDLHRWRAAVLHGGPGTMITGPTACAMVVLRYAPPPSGTVDLLADLSCRRGSLDFIRVHRTGRLPTSPHYWMDEELAAGAPPEWAEGERRPPGWKEIDELTGVARPGQLPIAPTPRAIVDACRMLARDRMDSGLVAEPGEEARLLRDTRAAMCEVVQDRRSSVDDLAAEVAASPRQHAAYVRTAMDDIAAGCRSAPECELRDLVRRTRGLPEPRWNRPLPDDPGVRPDACWPDARLVVEVDSRAWHGFGDAPERTERRRAAYAQLGWTVVPLSPARLRAEPEVVRTEIVQAYRAGLALRGT